MKVADDIRYNPTYVENLAEITAELVEAGAAGIFHVVGADEIVRFEFATRVAKAFGLDASSPSPTPMSKLGSSTPRPKESTRAPTRSARRSPCTPSAWTRGCARC